MALFLWQLFGARGCPPGVRKCAQVLPGHRLRLHDRPYRAFAPGPWSHRSTARNDRSLHDDCRSASLCQEQPLNGPGSPPELKTQRYDRGNLPSAPAWQDWPILTRLYADVGDRRASIGCASGPAKRTRMMPCHGAKRRYGDVFDAQVSEGIDTIIGPVDDKMKPLEYRHRCTPR